MPTMISSEYWLRELIIIKEQQAALLKSPKLVFLGGSSTLFGIDAKQVENAIGTPVMNMGLHGGMSASRILSIGRDVLNPGDTVVLLLEYPHYSCDGDAWDGWRVRSALTWDREQFSALPLSDRVGAVFASDDPWLMYDILWNGARSIVIPSRYTDRADALAQKNVIWSRYQSGKYLPSEFRYSAYNIDDRGDILNNEKAAYDGPGVAATAPGKLCPDIHALLQRFVADMAVRHVRVVIAHTPYLVEGRPAAGWQQAEADFDAGIHSLGLTLIDRRERLFFPRRYFFNTRLHLTDEGRHVRTNLLTEDLKRAGIGTH
jgi:hypothetical protein